MSNGQELKEGGAVTILALAVDVAGWLVLVLAADAFIIGLWKLYSWSTQ